VKRVVFLDRDGVICKEKNLFYGGKPILRPEDFEWIYGSKTALRELKELNFKTFVVTNQSSISKGILNFKQFMRINQPIIEEHPEIHFYCCPHRREENCSCRKPKIKFLLQAKKEHGVSLEDSYVIGDKTQDILMGKNAGCKTILVRTGYGGRDELYKVKYDFEVRDFLEAVRFLR